MPVSSLIPVHGAVQLGSNAGRLFVWREHLAWMPLGFFTLGAIAGAIAGMPLSASIDENLSRILLGLFVLLTVWWKPPQPGSTGRHVFALGGFLTTFATLFLGATGPLAAVFLARGLPDRHAFSATHAAAMTVQHGLKIAAFTLAGFTFHQWLGLVAIMIATGYAGTLAGSRLLDSFSPERFRLLFRWLVTLLAVVLLVRGLSGWYG